MSLPKNKKYFIEEVIKAIKEIEEKTDEGRGGGKKDEGREKQQEGRSKDAAREMI